MPDDRKKVSWKVKFLCFFISLISAVFTLGVIFFQLNVGWLFLGIFSTIVWFKLPVKLIRDEQKAKAWMKHEKAQERMRQEEEKRRNEDLRDTPSPEELSRQAKEKQLESDKKLATSLLYERNQLIKAGEYK